MKKTFKLMLTITIAAATVLAGCSQKEAATNSPAGSGQEAPKSNVTLKYWAAPLGTQEREERFFV
ncbi:hypothetical protein [Paenibacillus sp. PL2-23]|uniref:hypothetical protein n=1 Tax=Paenibacillus sp. PL2-23 TaxID=2100729 RepID=UPI0030F5A7FF